MGLDVYVRWDGITEDEEEAQYTGFSDSPDVGYMRYNWAGVKWMREMADKVGCSPPLPLYNYWNGFNDCDVQITEAAVGILQDEIKSWQDAKGKSGDDYFEDKLKTAEGMANLLIKKFNEGVAVTLCFY